MAEVAEYVWDSKGRTAGVCADCDTLMVFLGNDRTIVCLNCRANGRPPAAIAADKALVDGLAALSKSKKRRGSR